MNIKSIHPSHLLFFTVVALFFICTSSPVFAQEFCGNFIEEENGEEYVRPIEDCNNPFNVGMSNDDLVVVFGDTEIKEGSVYELLYERGSFSLENVSGNSVFFSLYRHLGEDYYIEPAYGNYTFTATGTYTIVVREEDLSVSGLFNTFWSTLMPTAHAAVGDSTAITFEVIAEMIAEEPEVDPLLLQYVPVLYMHEDEMYFPMNVESFVRGAALWEQSGVDTQLQAVDELTFESFETMIQAGVDTENTYLAYSDPDTAKSIDLDKAFEKYREAVDSGAATTTVYVHKMEDYYIDDYGVVHNFIVLQYWYFYAMNNWLQQGGFNNHEGDWESVFIFLDADTEEPEYVAYSAHHDDGDPEFNFLQSGSVRRGWVDNQVTFIDQTVASFVSLGSHAMYPENNDGKHPTNTKDDQTSTEGKVIKNSPANISSIDAEDQFWMNYQGKWGADMADFLDGKSGPLGPKYNTVSGHSRFHNPVEWAGIDQISEIVTAEPTTSITFTTANIHMQFADALAIGTVVTADPHHEYISFGIPQSDTTFLPRYYDFTTSMSNESFEVEVTLAYTDEELSGLSLDENDLSIFYYNPSIDTWEKVDTTVNTAANTISFITNHFSRYAIGVSEETELSIEELFTLFREETNDTGLRLHQKRFLSRHSILVEKFIERDSRSAVRIAKRLLSSLERKIGAYQRWKIMSNEEGEILLGILDQIKQRI